MDLPVFAAPAAAYRLLDLSFLAINERGNVVGTAGYPGYARAPESRCHRFPLARPSRPIPATGFTINPTVVRRDRTTRRPFSMPPEDPHYRAAHRLNADVHV